VHYATHGEGAPVVLLGTAPDDGAWERLLLALSANGLQAVEVELAPVEPNGDEAHGALLAVLHDRELASATFVGLNGGAVHVANFVAEYPERTDAVVFAGPALPMAAHEAELDGRALLLLTEDDAVPFWDEPELFADTVTDFVRRTVLNVPSSF
jgi:pimeloyl-ACP methyl ester carboxylesterase